MREMVAQCADAGFDGIFIHAREGLRTPYMSDAWLRAVEVCVEEAGSRDLAAWLYDEYPYPSGVAGGKVIQRNPQFSEKHLDIRRFPLEGGISANLPLGPGNMVAAFLVPRSADGASLWDEARRADAFIGVCNSTWISSDWDSRHYYDPEHARLYNCRRSLEAFPEQVFEGCLEQGSWELVVFFERGGGDFSEPFGHYVDVSNPEATRAFIEETHMRYRDRFGGLFGLQIPGVFTDEPKYRNALPWSATIAKAWEDFQRDPRALLALVRGDDGKAVRRSYRCATARLFLENWVRPIRDWCGAEGLRLVGHISPEEDWWVESRFVGSILCNLREFSIPGCDLIIPAVGDREHPVLNLTPTLAVSAAAQSGASHALCEVYGCSDYSLDPPTVKRISDWLLVCGINFLVPHACFYSLAGLRRFDAPPTFLPPMTLHPYLQQWTETVRETGVRLGPGLATGIALVRPMSLLYGMRDAERPIASALFKKGLETAQGLHERGLHFHWLDDWDLQKPLIEDGCLRIGRAQYHTLVLFDEPDFPQWPEVSRCLRAGGIALSDPVRARAIEGPLFCAAGDVRVAKEPGGEDYFCVNLSPGPRRFILEGRDCSLEGYESRWISPAAQPEGDMEQVFDDLALGAGWTLRPPERNVFRLRDWRWGGRKGGSPGPICEILPKGATPLAQMSIGLAPTSPQLEEVVCVEYATNFRLNAPVEEIPVLRLRIEEEGLRGPWEARVNGRRLDRWDGTLESEQGTVADIKPFLHDGDNEIVFQVRSSDARDGMLLCPFLEGAFVVADPQKAILGAPVAEAKGGDWTRLGYPHFSGTMIFETAFAWNGEFDAESAMLVFDPPPGGVVRVELNGSEAGTMLWAPWLLPIGGLVRRGGNRLRLHVTNSLQNFIYGEPLPSGPLQGAKVRVFPIMAKARPRAAAAVSVGGNLA